MQTIDTGNGERERDREMMQKEMIARERDKRETRHEAMGRVDSR